MEIQTIKMPWQIKHFNKGQNVFIEQITGAQACKCRGKFRGSGRWISAWFEWNDKNMHLVNIKTIDISEKDYNRIMKN